MTNKIQKIREGIEKLKSNLIHGACSSQVAMETRCKEEAYNEVLAILDSMQEVPISEELEEASRNYADDEEYGDDIYFAIKAAFKVGAQWQLEQFEKDCTDLCNGIATAKGIAVAMAYDKGVADTKVQMMKNIWKPADGDNLPEIDREVVVFTQNFPDDAGIMSVSIAHRPNPNGWDGKSVTTGKVEHYTPKTYDKGCWNIPDVKYWLDVKLPKEIEL